jgi:class 3 adenylate cyclase/tetratricopeptide (TPR) repeat protein
MRGCPRCGEQSDDRSSFCWSCGAPLVAALASVREVRKTVTAVFCDVVGSTNIGERQDPERLRWLMSRFFAEMAAIVERHGGTVGKFIGDAVMAVFGTPVVHEDDALRAVRAAAEMQDALVALNNDFEHALGVRFEIRIGINTGEVIAGDASRSDTLATGDAVNTAKRLESSARPGEILIGEWTYRLARHAIRAEALAPLAVKGKERPLRAYRVLEVSRGLRVRAQRFGSVFVGRERELALVRETLHRAVRERSCHLFTVLGQPGVGKSRLIDEAIRDAASGATVLRGSCLPYGEGITFWPVAELVRELAHADESDRGEDVRGKLTSLLGEDEDAAVVAHGVWELIGGTGERRPAEERFWAVRKLLEAIARQRPLVVVLDDIHWGEPTFLDLVEHVADWSRDAAILLVCIARPELLEFRTGWGGGKRNATTIRLEPLTEGESERLIRELLGSVALPEDVRVHVHEAAEGYPLFVEEIVSMLVDDGVSRREDGRWTVDPGAARARVPATINLLLASRIDRLPDDERDVLEWASVEGRTFHRGAVEYLSRSRAGLDLDRVLMGLVRKELVRPERPQLHGEDAYRFRHILIRDAAYDSLPKHARAELHERFAAWLAATTGDETVDYDDFVGYHLEQAFRYRKELRRVEPVDRELAARAGRHLASAGSRARMRGDVPAAVKLLGRAVRLLREDQATTPEMLIELGSVLVETGDLTGSDAVFAEAAEAASGAGDVRLANRATLERSFVQVLVDPAYDSDHLREIAEAAIPAFEEVGDELGVATALTRVAEAHWDRCHFAAMEVVLEKALVHATRAGDEAEIVEILGLLSWAVVVGPRPVTEAIPRCREILERAREQPRLEAWTESMLAVLEAMRGQSEVARALYRNSQQVLANLGLKIHLASAHMCAGMAELVMSQPVAAEREFRRGYALLDEMGERAQLSTMAAFLARALIAQGRYGAAEPLTVVSEEAASDDDLASQVLWRGARAQICAARGELEHAERLARAAVDLARSSDFLNIPADVLMDLARVLRVARPDDAEAAIGEALSLYEAKGNMVSAAEARALRLEWGAASTA